MAPPTPLAITTSSVRRLVKEEASYHTELAQQEGRLQRTEAQASSNTSGGDENLEYQIRQERRAIDETKKVFPQLRRQVEDAAAKLDNLLESEGGEANAEEVARAREALAEAKTSRTNGV